MSNPPPTNTSTLPADPSSDQPPAAGSTPAARPPGRHLPWASVFRCTFVVFVVLVLAGIFLPVFNTTAVKGCQTKSLAQAKQIGLALRLYAGDHDGVYPTGTNPETGEPIRTANDAFRVLLPTYTQSEALFGNKLSAYQSAAGPDNVIGSGRTLQPGENVYSYVAGLNDANNPNAPLLVDGTDGTGRGTFSTDQHARGGAWKGTKAIVIRLDNSGMLMNLKNTPPAPHIEETLPDGTRGNPLSPAGLATYQLKPDAPLRLLDPAYDPSRKN